MVPTRVVILCRLLQYFILFTILNALLKLSGGLFGRFFAFLVASLFFAFAAAFFSDS